MQPSEQVQPVVVTPEQAALGRRSYVPWRCGGCHAVLPFPHDAEIACPRCGRAPEGSARLAGRLEALAAAADDPTSRKWLEASASAWRLVTSSTA